MNNLELLRRFEPVIKYTRGENFFPMDVDRYVAECSLWEARPDSPPTRLVEEGQLSLDKLVEPHPAPHNTVHYLRFVESLSAGETARYLAKRRQLFKRSRGRLARVGLLSRVVDALFSITLMMRGRVPGGTAAAAWEAYRRLQENDPRYVYYGRVVRQGGFICLQYWFFYCMNDWRSGFYGVNDHESDWEQVIVYLSEDEQPQWVAYASHDFTGDDLRRRWDDPELRRDGNHPIIYAGAGSHASYFSPGEYMHEVAMPFSGPLTRAMRVLERFWRDTLKQGEVREDGESAKSGVLVVPFVDYARGDGIAIGFNSSLTWEARLLPDTHDMSPDHPQAWAHHFRGLWGLYARDPIAGENAPAGPKYNRDGSVRSSWVDPLAWAGLDKVTPQANVPEVIDTHVSAIARRQAEAEAAIAAKRAQLRALGLETDAMYFAPHLKSQYAEHQKLIQAMSDEAKALQKSIAVDFALIEALKLYKARLQQGQLLPVRRHIKHAHHPSSETAQQLGRLAEAWAALSIGLLLLGFIVVVAIAPRFWLNGLVSLVSVISFIEALFRREAKELVNRAVVALSLTTVAVLAYEFALPLLAVGIVALGIFIMVENLRELAG